ncbi:MAG: hypothetical protein V4440_08630 [Pseudomonadota bacterium]
MIEKQNLNIGFTKGLDLKTDPFLVPPGRFLSLINTIFTNNNLTKRNGFGRLTSLPDANSTDLTTFNGALAAIGSSVYAYSSGSATWTSKGTLVPLSLNVLPIVKSNTNQSQVDSAVSSNGLICTVYTDVIPPSPTSTYKYVISDLDTGLNIIAPSLITPSAGAVSGSPRVFVLGGYFIIVFTVTITATPHLQYIAINRFTPTRVSTAVDLSATYTPASTVAFDGFVANNNLYVSFEFYPYVLFPKCDSYASYDCRNYS